ncbi:MAG: hypothetical protein LBM99_01465, partial [Bacillales bacterium]|nr:hypothetical protein [Bacillales bacterium]
MENKEVKKIQIRLSACILLFAFSLLCLVFQNESFGRFLSFPISILFANLYLYVLMFFVLLCLWHFFTKGKKVLFSFPKFIYLILFLFGASLLLSVNKSDFDYLKQYQAWLQGDILLKDFQVNIFAYLLSNLKTNNTIYLLISIILTFGSLTMLLIDPVYAFIQFLLNKSNKNKPLEPKQNKEDIFAK